MTFYIECYFQGITQWSWRSAKFFTVRLFASVSKLTIQARGEGTPIYGVCRYVPRNGVRFLRFSVINRVSVLTLAAFCVPGVVLR